MIRGLASMVVAALMLPMASCGDAGDADRTAESPTTAAAPSSSTIATVPDVGERTIVSFPDPSSVAGWTNVDDTVMGGVSDSTTSWSDEALLFTGRVSLENNGGFSSTIGPLDRGLGDRARGSTELVVEAQGDGRTYLLSVIAGASGTDRWIARFTGSGRTRLPVDSFEAVDRFLRPTRASAPFDPATIVRIGIYLTDGQQGEFSLALRRIVGDG